MTNRRRRYSLWLRLGGMIMILFVIAACGGGEEAAPTPTAATVADTPAPAEEEEEMEAAPTETAVPPTETAAATETAVPATPTMAPTATATPNEEASQSAAGQTACDHPYFPLREGATWTYTDGSDTYEWLVESVEGDAENATAELQVTVSDVIISYSWDCSAEEGLASFDFANLTLAQTPVDMNIELEQGSGRFLPPAEELELGYTWQISYTNNISYTQEAGGTTITATGDMVVDEMNEVISTEPVTLEDGATADGIQIARSDEINLTINVMDQVTTQPMSLSGAYTFAKGIGMVRQVSESDFGSNELVLVSYDIP